MNATDSRMTTHVEGEPMTEQEPTAAPSGAVVERSEPASGTSGHPESATEAVRAALANGTAGVMVCYTRCWPCQFDSHFDPPEAHTWMDEDDAAHEGIAWPLVEPDAPGRRCGCPCAKSEATS